MTTSTSELVDHEVRDGFCYRHGSVHGPGFDEALYADQSQPRTVRQYAIGVVYGLDEDTTGPERLAMLEAVIALYTP